MKQFSPIDLYGAHFQSQYNVCKHWLNLGNLLTAEENCRGILSKLMQHCF